MKNIQYLLILLFACSLFSCQKEESKLTNGLLTITAGQDSDPGLKTNIGAPGTYNVTWNSTDNLAVFDGTEPNKNVKFSYSGGAGTKSATFTGTVDGWTSGSRTFYAVYPYDAANTGSTHTTYVITIPQPQIQDFTSGNTYNHLGLYDYMAAAPKTIEYAGQSTLADNFSFEHLMAVLDIEVTNSTGFAIKVLQIRMKRATSDFTLTASLDLTKSPGAGGFYTPGANANQLILGIQNAGTTANAGIFTGSMIIAPADLAAANTDFEVSVLIEDPGSLGNWQGNLYTVTKTTAFSIARGQRYKAQITIAPASLTQLTYESKSYRLTGIGTQVWMAENMAYLTAMLPSTFYSATKLYYYVYNYLETDVAAAKATAEYTTYGVLYNWPAAMNGSASSTSVPSGVQGVCPSGWHLPSNAEWTILSDYLTTNGYGYGGSGSDIGKSLAATSNWTADPTAGAPGNDPGSNNSSGFTALPGGYSSKLGFGFLGYYAYFWSASGNGTSLAWARGLYYYYDGVSPGTGDRSLGFSVRCLRNN